MYNVEIVLIRCYALVNCKKEFVTPGNGVSWLEKCWPRGVSKSNFCQNKSGMCVMVRQIYGFANIGSFCAAHVDCKKCLTSPRSRLARSPSGLATAQLSLRPKPKPHTPLSCTCTWYMCFGAHAPSPQRVRQFRGLTLVLWNWIWIQLKWVGNRTNWSTRVTSSPRIYDTFHKQIFSLALVYRCNKVKWVGECTTRSSRGL